MKDRGKQYVIQGCENIYTINETIVKAFICSHNDKAAVSISNKQLLFLCNSISTLYHLYLGESDFNAAKFNENLFSYFSYW